jgi:hypothetical protein
VLLFGIPGFFVSGIIALVAFGATAGILWLFIFGDNAWPASTEPLLSVFVIATFLLLWIFSIVAGYAIGKTLETNSEWNRAHILISVGLTLAFILFILLQQVSVGNLGPKSDSALCSDFCVQHGYSGSGMPPANSGDRTCSCYDNSGNETLKVPLESIDTESLK